MGIDWKAFRPEYLGFAAVVATLPVYEPALHSFHTLAPEAFGRGVPPYTCAALVAALATALAMFAIRLRGRTVAKDGEGRRARRRLCAAVAALTFLSGTAGLCLLTFIDLPAVFSVALGTCGGIGSALLLAAWGKAFLACEGHEALGYLAVSSVLGGLLLNTVGTLPHPVAVALLFLLAGVALGIPLMLLRENPEQPEGPETQNSQRPASELRPADALVGTALFGMSFHMLGTHEVYLFYLTFLVGTIAAGVAILPLVLLGRERPAVGLLYEVALPLVGFATVAGALVAPGPVGAFAARTGFMLFFAFAAPFLLVSAACGPAREDHDPQLPLLAATACFTGGSLLGLVVGRLADVDACLRAFSLLMLAYLVFLAMSPGISAQLREIRGTRRDTDAPTCAPTALDAEELGRITRRFGLTGREAEILPLTRTGTHIHRDRAGALHIGQHRARACAQDLPKVWRRNERRAPGRPCGGPGARRRGLYATGRLGFRQATDSFTRSPAR